MQIEIKIDESCTEPKIIIVTDKMTDDVNEIFRKLSTEKPAVIAGFKEGLLEIIDPEQIFRIFATNGKVFVETHKGEYMLRLRLYELEQQLDGHVFVRISNSEIINMKKVAGFDLSFVGTVCVKLTNGTITYVSGRYVSKIKQILGI